MTTQPAFHANTESARAVGNIAIGSAIGLTLVLGVHPFGTTDLYGDGAEFTEHPSGVWIAIHLAAAILMLAFPMVVGAWAASLTRPGARVWGRLAETTAILGTAVGVIHLVGTDTILIAFFADTVTAAGTDATVSADLVMRLHAATLTSWIIGFWIAVPLVAGTAAWIDGRRGWEVWLPAAMVVMLTICLGITLNEGQYTTLSDMVFFRIPGTLFIIWIALIGIDMRKRDAPTSSGRDVDGD